ncbi:MAG: MATE family efflux transporter [Streptococcus sp.]
MAGVSTATSLWTLFSFLTGIVSALTPIVGHHLGKGNKERLSDFYQFLYVIWYGCS